MLKDDEKRIERLARKNRDRSLQDQKKHTTFDKPTSLNYDLSGDKDEDLRYVDADKLFNEMKQKPRYD